MSTRRSDAASKPLGTAAFRAQLAQCAAAAHLWNIQENSSRASKPARVPAPVGYLGGDDDPFESSDESSDEDEERALEAAADLAFAYIVDILNNSDDRYESELISTMQANIRFAAQQTEQDLKALEAALVKKYLVDMVNLAQEKGLNSVRDWLAQMGASGQAGVY
jgi:hypothetical protein